MTRFQILNYNIVYFDDFDICVCPKNGSSSIIYAKTALLGLQDQGLPYSGFLKKEFREGMPRLAVKRDPVDRFRSAVVQLRKSNQYATVDMAISMVSEGEIPDEHFIPQKIIMGDIGAYAEVIPLDHLDDLMIRLGVEYEVHINKKRENIELTNSQIEQIKSLYKIDYEGGWHD